MLFQYLIDSAIVEVSFSSTLPSVQVENFRFICRKLPVKRQEIFCLWVENSWLIGRKLSVFRQKTSGQQVENYLFIDRNFRSTGKNLLVNSKDTFNSWKETSRQQVGNLSQKLGHFRLTEHFLFIGRDFELTGKKTSG